MKVLHITTVHPRRDTRIFYRECVSLKNSGFEVVLLVSDGKGNEINEGIEIRDIGVKSSRILNFLTSRRKIMDVVHELQPVLVHFHDPELMFVGNRISKIGIPVIFDIHENVSAQILNKPYIAKLLRQPISKIYEILESYFIKELHLVLAENSYYKVYKNKGKSSTVVLNMPEQIHFEKYINTSRNSSEIFYIGGVSDDRGLSTTIDALKILKDRGLGFFMHYIGPISDKQMSEIDTGGISENINFYGRMDSKLGFEISKQCSVGLSVLKPIKNYVESYSTKIFEYMAVGLPVITSNFKLYREVVEKHECGYCIDPNSKEELADKIEMLIKDSDLVNKMGKNGIDAVSRIFNWKTEEHELLKLYKKLLNFA